MPEGVRLGQQVFFVDDERIVHPAQVASIFPADPPILNLAFLTHEAHVRAAIAVTHGWHDGAKWRVLDKWFTQEEMDDNDIWAEVKIPEGKGHKFTNAIGISHKDDNRTNQYGRKA